MPQTTPDHLRDLLLLHALGEPSAEPPAQLLKDNPELAQEHAAVSRLAHLLSLPTDTLPAMPTTLLTSLPAPNPSNIRPFPWRVWAAGMAACLAATFLCSKFWSTAPPSSASTPSTLPIENDPAPMVASRGGPSPVVARSTSPTRRAVLIAVECWPDKEKDPERGAGWQDLQHMTKLLTEKWGFAKENIHTVFNKEATLKNAVAAIQTELIAKTHPGDSVVIYWSSHGTQVSDLDGDEPDGLDEAYCPYDFNWSTPETWFTDDLFAALLEQIDTRDILVIADTCHSGGSTRGTDDSSSENLPRGLASGFVPAATLNPQAQPHKSPSHVILLSACAQNELSYAEVGKGGHLTTQLTSLFSSANAESLTFQKARDSVTTKIQGIFKGFTVEPSNPKTWTPQAEGPTTKKISTFLNPPVPPATPPTPPSPPPPPLPIWQRQSGEISLNLTTDKSTYQAGDLMQITLTPDLDCHLRLYYLSADHKVLQIFPNQYQSDGLVKKGQPVTLPGAGGKFDFKMGAPFGNEILMAVASSLPFTDQNATDVQNQLFQEFKDTNLEQLGTRGIEVTEKKALTGRALYLYRVEEAKK